MIEQAGQFEPDGQDIPLVVDMDGTLVCSDTLYEGVVELLKQDGIVLTLLPWWLLRGKAALKSEIACRIDLDVGFLPYNDLLISRLQTERSRRRIVLCTAADHRIADAVASHLGIFDEVLATNGKNLDAPAKARLLVDRFGEAGFDYAANDSSDLSVFSKARYAIVVNPTGALKRRRGRIGNIEQTLDSRTGLAWSPYIRALRPHQWLKNLLVFVPLLATIGSSGLEKALQATLAFLAFSLVASSVYLLNDLLDLRADRRHKWKKGRPFAAGTMPISHGLLFVPALLVAGLMIAGQVSGLFLLLVLLYLVSATAYTFWLKRVPLLDTLVLGGLYTLRVIAGAAAIAVVPSPWLLAFSMFFFLSIALAKRHSELLEMPDTPSVSGMPGRGYRREDSSTLISQGSASGYAAVLVLALYIDSAEIRAQYNQPQVMWLVCPLLLYWINKLWLNSQRKEIEDDPVIWAVTNRVSRGIAILSVLLILLARYLPAA